MHPQTPHQRKTASPAAGAGHAGDDALGNLPHNPSTGSGLMRAGLVKTIPYDAAR